MVFEKVRGLFRKSQPILEQKQQRPPCVYGVVFKRGSINLDDLAKLDNWKAKELYDLIHMAIADLTDWYDPETGGLSSEKDAAYQVLKYLTGRSGIMFSRRHEQLEFKDIQKIAMLLCSIDAYDNALSVLRMTSENNAHVVASEALSRVASDLRAQAERTHKEAWALLVQALRIKIGPDNE